MRKSCEFRYADADFNFDVSNLIHESYADSVFPYSIGYYIQAVRSITLDCDRVEGYLLDEYDTPIACVIYQMAEDIHYGLVAIPSVTFLAKSHRGNKETLRAVSHLTKEVVEALGVTRYYTVKHINTTTQIHRLRTL